MVADKPTDTDGAAPADAPAGTPKAPRGAAPNPLAPAARKPVPAAQQPTPTAQRPTVFRPEIVRRAAEQTGSGTRNGVAIGPYTEGKKLVVGREITLSGAISACEILVVEGCVEASITDCREIEVADGGTFKGEAAIELAEIKGSFVGTLIARELLLIRATGRVAGKVRFGRLEVERGGRIEGDVGTYVRGEDTDAGSGGAPVA